MLFGFGNTRGGFTKSNPHDPGSAKLTRKATRYVPGGCIAHVLQESMDFIGMPFR